MHRRPPAAVSPEMAFVTAMSGVCRAGFTDQTDWYPAITARVKVVTMPKKAGSGQRQAIPIKELRPAAAFNAFD